MAKRNEIVGMKELERSMKRLGKVPQTAVSKAARAGTTIACRAAKRNAPVEEGDLRDGIIMKRERRVKFGKAVYDVMMDPAKNDIFVKMTVDGKRYYYPASQEFGFITADGGYVPGYHFLRRSVTENTAEIEGKMVNVMVKDIDKAWRKR